MPVIRSMALVAFLVPALDACTIMAMKQDVNKREAVVAMKEEDLKGVEAEQARLHEQSVQLKNDLATRQVSLDELKLRLEQLQQANAKTAEDTDEQRERKRQRSVKLKSHQADLMKVEQSPATAQQKQKKIESIRKDIVNTLNILLQS